MKTKVLVISEPQSDRYHLIKQHLDELHVALEVCPAIFLSGESPWASEYDQLKRKNRFGYEMTRGEVGCFLAHRAAWSHVIKSNQTTLIIEDDARLMPSLINTLDDLSDTINDTCILIRLFSVHHPKSYLWRETSSKIKVVRPSRHGSSTVAYLLNPKTATRLLSHSNKFWTAVDDYMDAEHVNNCVIMHAVPEMVKHDDQGVSAIGSRVKPSQGIISVIKREVIRALSKTQIFFHREATLWKLGIKFSPKITQ
jgi:glycosyl transferase family 25